jgi:hypothetical protein
MSFDRPPESSGIAQGLKMGRILSASRQRGDHFFLSLDRRDEFDLPLSPALVKNGTIRLIILTSGARNL